MFNRIDFFMMNKFFPSLAILNLLFCMSTIMVGGWSWQSGINIILSVMYMDWFFNSDSDLYRKSK